MKKNNQKFQKLFRELNLLKPIENVRYLISLWTTRKRNAKFIKENPNFSLPPAYLAFDAYSAPDWEFYQKSGMESARFLKAVADEHLPKTTVLESVYEWGCGPGRIIRHLPNAFGKGVKIHGSDYNENTIAWCKKNLSNIDFQLNQLSPPLPYPSESFNLIYTISVFTHLSEQVSLDWIGELYRVLKPGGVILITTNGDYSASYLLPEEKVAYDTQGVAVRGNYEEGKKMFLAFHKPSYVRSKLLSKFSILKHEPNGFPQINQDMWIARK